MTSSPSELPSLPLLNSHRSSRSSGASFRECLNQVNYNFFFAIAVATLGPLQFGYHLSELNAPQDVITCLNPSLAEEVASTPDLESLPKCIPMNEAAFALLSSMYVLGGFLGAITAGPISTRRGRWLPMLGTAVLFILGSTLETFSTTHAMLAAGRFFSGIGAGASTVIVPLYIAEVSPADAKGMFGTLTQITINIGILATQTLGHFLSRGSLWRIILGVAGCIAVLQLVGLFFVRESPKWLATSDHPQPDKARAYLLRLRKDHDGVDKEIMEWDLPYNSDGAGESTSLLRDPESHAASPDESGNYTPLNIKLQRQSKIGVGFFGVITRSEYRPAIIAVIGIMFAQQLCGINSIMMYSVSMLRGLLPMESSLVSIFISIVNLITTIACSPLSDRIGRKACLLLSISGMGFSSLLLAISLRLEAQHLSAISVLLFVAFFATGLGPVPFIMASELVGPEANGATQSVCLGANYVATFLVAQFFPLINTGLNDRFGGKGWAYFVFFGLAVLSFFFVSRFVPETKGKTPDEAWSAHRGEDHKQPHHD